MGCHALTLPFPKDVPLFDFSGTVLLPKAQLPICVRDLKYVQLIEDALLAGRYVGVVQPRPENEESTLFKTGCLGKITSFSEQDDGVHFVVLTGLMRFDLLRDYTVPQGYRRGCVDYDRFMKDTHTHPMSVGDRDALLDVLNAHVRDVLHQDEWQHIIDSCDESLVSLLAMLAPLAPIEKQAILETESLEERWKLVVSLARIGASFLHLQTERFH